MESERQYLDRRAREEDAAADRALCDKARELHIELAGRYRDAADGRAARHVPDEPARPGLPDEFRILD